MPIVTDPNNPGQTQNVSLRRARQLAEQGAYSTSGIPWHGVPDAVLTNQNGNGAKDAGTVPEVNEQKRLEAISKGEEGLSEATKIQQETLVNEDGKVPEGTLTGKDNVQQIEGINKVGQREAAVEGIGEAAQGKVSTAQVNRIPTQTMQASKVGRISTVEAAKGAVSKLAEAGQADFDPALDGQTISEEEIDEGKALTVEGALSSGAFAEAAKGEKSQVDTGGLPALEDIDLMGPEVQAQVAELPEEALVTTQMNSLLEGIEKGKTPAWALPAVEAVEAQLAERGMSASSVGRNALFSAIVSSALPLAQGNAQALQQRAAQNLSNRQQAEITEAQLSQQGAVTQFQGTAELQALNARLAQEMNVAELSNEQQAAIYNATAVAGLDMAKFSAAQQVELANSAWMQTASLSNLSNKQQAILQEATLLSQQDMANADAVTKASIENARNFLQMDVTNLSNEQQAAVVNQQSQLQRLFSNQAAENAARQFNAASENQVNTFMANLQAQVAQQNAVQLNALEQFNTSQKNTIATQDAVIEADIEKLNTQLGTQVDQFNTQVDFQREQWNSANAQAIEQSNVAWRRQANTADTAAANAINQQNAMNAFNLESSALSMLWQQLRDEAAFDQQSYITYQTNATNLYATALSHEKPKDSSFSKIDTIIKTLDSMMS